MNPNNGSNATNSPIVLRINKISTAAAIDNLCAVNNSLKSTVNTCAGIAHTSNVSTLVQKGFQTPNSLRKARNGTFSSFPIVNTPTPPSRYRKIINPFEAGLTERLHLPLIDR